MKLRPPIRRRLRGRRAYWPATPQSTPPYPFTEWPYGGTTNLGVTRPSSVDSPLMVALANTSVGSWMNDNHIQVYGWIDPGGNLSTSTVRGGNAPAAYSYNPNTVQLDQAVVYIERLPDTVQKDHVDWGFRVAPIYGENYRYTTAYGLFSSQLLNQNHNNGFDIPMAYGEVFIPQVAEGMMIRFGRFISIPDIEAQLAPNNYMYSHSMTYTFDNYTNTGIQVTTALNKNWIFQTGLVTGTEAMPWHVGAKINNPFPNPLFPNTTMLKDPGAVPSVTLGVRWTSDDGRRRHQHRRRRHQQRHVGLQQPAMVRFDVLSQVQRPVAHLVRNLQRASEQRAEPAQSGRLNAGTGLWPAEARRSRRNICRSTLQAWQFARTRPFCLVPRRSRRS